MLYRARSIPVPLIDATPVVMAVHQNHDYSHHAQGKDGVYNGDEALTNDELAGGWLHTFTISDATHLLTPQKLRLTYYDRTYLARHLDTLPFVHPSVDYQCDWYRSGTRIPPATVPCWPHISAEQSSK